MSERISARRAVLVMLAALLVGALVFMLTRADRVVDRVEAQAVLAPPSVTASTNAAAADPTSSLVSPGVAGKPATRAATLPPAPAGDPPRRLTIKGIDVDMTVIPVGVSAQGDMQIPEDVRVAGWYRYGPDPSSRQGAVVIAAHVDSAKVGAGPLARLPRARPGDEITLLTEQGRIEYVVKSTNRFDKDALDLGMVFDRSGPTRLHLITCGGAFDRKTRHYEDNVVVVAERR